MALQDTTAPPAPTKGAQTRQAILDAAIARFGREGYRATAVADIARDAGIGGTVAYAYFPNKEALFLAAVDEDANAIMHEGLSSVLDPPEGFLDIFGGTIEISGLDPPLDPSGIDLHDEGNALVHGECSRLAPKSSKKTGRRRDGASPDPPPPGAARRWGSGPFSP